MSQLLQDFGKRRSGRRVNLGPHPETIQPEEILEIRLVADEDERLFVPVDVYGRKFMSLVDSGATRSVVGGRGWEVMQRLGVRVVSSKFKVARVADGRQLEIVGSVMLPSNISGSFVVWEFIVVPAIKHDLILGVDFFNKHKAIADFGQKLLIIPPPDIQVDEVIVSRDHLTEEQTEKMDSLVGKFKPRLGKPGVGCTDRVEHKIDTGDSPPIQAPIYHYSPKLREILNDGLDEWLKCGVVEPSKSPWRASILLVRKKSKDYRWVVDFRRLNKVSKKDAYPMPRVNDILDSLRDAKYLSSIDLKSAYFQIPLDQESKEKTAFVIPGRGLFQFTRMPQGLNTSAATWQRFIDKVLGEDLRQNVFVYLDDIIIAARTFEHHMEILEKVFTRLMEAGLTVNFEKCDFCRPELKYLGYVINEDGLMVNPEKVSAITEFPRPNNPAAVRRFVGLASWYRRFVPNFSTIMSPLHDLTGKRKCFVWNDDCEEAFTSIKKLLTTAPVLSCPDFEKEFTLHCDASGVGLGAILSQEFEDGEKVIAYASRSLSKQERKYSATELECLAVLWAIEKFRCYLEGYTFTVVTDHSSLKWLDNLKDPVGRLGRWAVRLQQYDYKIVHRKGKENEAPDALSRAPLGGEDSEDYAEEDVPKIEIVSFDKDVEDGWYVKLRYLVLNNPAAYPHWKVEDQLLYKKIFNGIRAEAVWVKVIPKEMRARVYEECHDSPTAGHFGFFKTFNRIRQRYYWPRMREDIADYIDNCHVCLQVKPRNTAPAGLMGQQRVVDAPLQNICTDLISLTRSSSGYTHVVVSTCQFSKYVWVRPLRSPTAAAVAKHLEEDIFLKFGVPQRLICDNGSEFIGKEVRDLCDKYRVEICRSFKYHPQANPTERYNQTLKIRIKAYLGENQRLWERNLHKYVAAMNTSVHEITKRTPHFLMFGSEMTDDGRAWKEDLNLVEKPALSAEARMKNMQEIREDVRDKLKVAHERNALRYNLRRRDVDLEIGQIVYRKNFAKSNKLNFFNKKLAPPYLGPYTVKERVGYRGYLLVDEEGEDSGPWHIQDLKIPKKGETLGRGGCNA